MVGAWQNVWSSKQLGFLLHVREVKVGEGKRKIIVCNGKWEYDTGYTGETLEKNVSNNKPSLQG